MKLNIGYLKISTSIMRDSNYIKVNLHSVKGIHWTNIIEIYVFAKLNKKCYINFRRERERETFLLSIAISE